MKKIIILLFVIPFVFVSCLEVDTPTEHPFFVHLHKQFCPGCSQEAINATISSHHYLFKDMGKEVDIEKSYTSVHERGTIVYTDGSEDKYIYSALPYNPTSGETVGFMLPGGSGGEIPAADLTSYKFSDIPNGNYILFVTFSENGFEVDGAAYKNIIVNYDYRFKIEKKVFLYKKQENGEYKYGYQDWNERWW